MKYHLITYGCQMNTADSEEMAQPLKDRGFLATAQLQEADIILMNTCTVRDQAEHRADSNIGRLRAWKAKDPNRILIIAGCAASRWGESIQKKYPFIDLVSPATQIEQFPEAVAQVLQERWNWQAETAEAFDAATRGRGETEADSIAVSPRPRVAASNDLFGSQATAYITVMRGCNYACSYCIVPQVRGREKYRPLPDILAEARAKIAEGYGEVMLLGQTVNSYFWRGEIGDASGAQRCAPTNHLPLPPMYDFSDLLRAVDAVPGLESIRFMSPHPRHMKDRVIQAMADCRHVARHVHLPVQSGSDRLLGQMRRHYTRGDYLAIVAKLRAAMPGILITTDIIVGYPGETSSDFGQTVTLIQDAGFGGLFAFKYSPRPGTTAAQVDDDVPALVKEDRLQAVLSLVH